MDADRGQDQPGTKVMAEISLVEFTERALDRMSNRELDAAIQDSKAYRQSSRDAGSAFPRDASGNLRHPAMARRLPIPDERRRPISARQKSARCKLKNDVQDRLSGAQYRELARLIESDEAWTALNNELSDCIGNMQELSDTSRRRVRRIDRTIQSYEESCGREHLVYVRVQLPAYVPAERALQYARRHFGAGDTMTFDRYTLATHQMHEHERFPRESGAVILLELKTRRGMYLGGSDGRDDTAHLLPRALNTRVVTAPQEAGFRRPDGTAGTEIVVQVMDDRTREG